MRRGLTQLLILALIATALVTTSRIRARQVAIAYVGSVPDVAHYREGSIPLGRVPPRDSAWAWAVPFTSTYIPGHIVFEVYVSPLGRVLGTNPSELPEFLQPEGRRAGDTRLRHN